MPTAVRPTGLVVVQPANWMPGGSLICASRKRRKVKSVLVPVASKSAPPANWMTDVGFGPSASRALRKPVAVDGVGDRLGRQAVVGGQRNNGILLGSLSLSKVPVHR